MEVSFGKKNHYGPDCLELGTVILSLGGHHGRYSILREGRLQLGGAN